MAIDKTLLWIGGAVVGGAILGLAGAASAASGGSVGIDNATDPNVPASYRDVYLAKWNDCVVLPARLASVDRLIDRILAVRDRYTAVSAQTGVPWWFIGTIHSLEADLSFSSHLHNGDPLSARTVQVPAGRPVAGSPPFTWEESAVDALQYDGLTNWHDWNLVGSLYRLEKFNGTGYHNRGIPSPYLWSFSNQYTAGKYVADGQFSATAVSQQCGGATLWKRMTQRGIISF